MVDNSVEFFRETSSTFPESFDLDVVAWDEVDEEGSKGSGGVDKLRFSWKRSESGFSFDRRREKTKSETHLRTSMAASPNLRALIAPKGRPTKT